MQQGRLLIFAMILSTSAGVHRLDAGRIEAGARPDLPALSPILPEDRVLVLAPHPDDEVLGCGGVIQKAVAMKARLRVVYLTHGDHNEWAFIRYRKIPWLTPAINRNLGEVRRQEAIAGIARLGVPASDLVFLGFPDNGTLEIWVRHWDEARPAKSVLTNTRQVPYKDATGYGQPYKGEEIVAALRAQLLEFRPTRVFVTGLADGNPDHRALFLFLQVALLDLGDHIERPQVLTYPIHFGPWPRPAKYRPELWLTLPRLLRNEDIPSWLLELTPDQVENKRQALLCHKTQTSYSESWMVSFARRNELCSSPRTITLRSESQSPMPGASEMTHVHSTAETEAYEADEMQEAMTGVTFRQTPEHFVVRITLRRGMDDDDVGISVAQFGYRPDRPFGQMPKIRLSWQDGSLTVLDQSTPVHKSNVQVRQGSKEITFLTPWNLLERPEMLFVQVRGLRGVLPVSELGWEMVKRTPFTAMGSKP